MINYKHNEIFEKVSEAKNNLKSCYFKDFISDDSIPTWNDFLNCIYKVSSIEAEDNLKKWIKQVNHPGDFLKGKLLITDFLYFSPLSVILVDFFPTIVKDIEIISSIFKQEFGVAPKISMSDRVLDLHKDEWDAFTIQCEGTSLWKLSNDTGYSENFYLERGDFLFFPKNVKHSIEVSRPRAGLVFSTDNILKNIDT